MFIVKFIWYCTFHKASTLIITRYYAGEGWRRLYIISQHHSDLFIHYTHWQNKALCFNFFVAAWHITWTGAGHRANRERLGKDTEVIQLYACQEEVTMASSWASKWHSHKNCKTIITAFIFKLQITGVLETSLVMQRRNRSFYTKILNIAHVPLLVIKQYI